MANYNQLKQAVTDVIKTNGNQEITGELLQNVLLTMVSSLGKYKTFAGVVDASFAPPVDDGNIFYIASQEGIYPNFGGITVSLNDGINFIVSNPTGGFEKIILPIQINLKDYSTNESIIDSLSKIGISLNVPNSNIIKSYAGSNMNDSSIWGVGYLRSNGTIADDQTTWVHSLKYIPISEISYPDVFLRLYGGASLVYYDKDKNVIGFVQTANTNYQFSDPLNPPANTRYFRFSQPKNFNNTGLKISSSQSVFEVRDDVFVKREILRSIGVYSSTRNLIDEYAKSDVSNTELWGKGFLHINNGSVQPGEWSYTKQYIEIIPGIELDIFIRINGNAGLIFYDDKKVFISSLSGNTPSSFTGKSTTPPGAKYFRFSHQDYLPLNTIFIRSKQTFYSPTSSVFVKSVDLVSKMDSYLKNFGIIHIVPNTNYLSELTNSSLEDSTLWGVGYLHYNGTVQPGDSWRYSIKSYKIYPGLCNVNLRISGNARCWVLDDIGNIVRTIQNPGTGSNFIGQVEFLEGEDSIRVSWGATSGVNALNCSNVSDVYHINGANNDTPRIDMREIYRSQFQPVEYHPPVITFISDDCGIRNDWFLDMLNEYGFKAGFALISGRMGTNPDFFNKEQAMQLYFDGHNILNHTWSHDGNNQLATLTEAQLNKQIVFSKIKIQQLDDRLIIDGFVSPFGSRNALVDKVCRKVHKMNFVTRADSEITNKTIANLPPILSYNLKRASFDASANDISRIDLMKQAVDAVIETGGWLVFAMHPHYAEYITPNSIDRQNELRQLFDYIVLRDVPVLTPHQGYELYGNRVELGYRTNDVKSYALGADGNEYNSFF